MTSAMAMDYIRISIIFTTVSILAYARRSGSRHYLHAVSILIADRGFPLEEILVVNKVNLHPGRLNGCYLNDQRMVRVVNNKIHTRQTDNSLQWCGAHVDISNFGMGNTVAAAPNSCGKFLHIMRSRIREGRE